THRGCCSASGGPWRTPGCGCAAPTSPRSARTPWTPSTSPAWTAHASPPRRRRRWRGNWRKRWRRDLVDAPCVDWACSPPKRGWSDRARRAHHDPRLFPADAGSAPVHSLQWAGAIYLPGRILWRAAQFRPRLRGPTPPCSIPSPTASARLSNTSAAKAACPRPTTPEGCPAPPPTSRTAATGSATLSARLSATSKTLRGKGRLSAADIAATAREIRIALLEADVALPVVRSFIKNVKDRALGAE